jgi:dihydroorotate dehydrogenase electron transfer subunit
MIKCGGDTLLRRPISIHSVTGDSVDLLYASTQVETDLRSAEPDVAIDNRIAKGAGTRWLSQVKQGDRLESIGPAGNGFHIDPSAKSILLVAGGIGVAPLKFLAETALSLGKKVTFAIGARTAAGVYPIKYLPVSIELLLATEDGSIGEKAMVTDLIPEYFTRSDQIFACGPKAMYEALSDSLEKQNAKNPVQVSLEVRMGCGTGVCYSCSIRTKQGMKRACKEGPIFNIRDIIWQEVRI